MSTWLNERCGVSLNSGRWSSRIYGQYLERMRTWAAAFSLTPETLEQIIFSDQATALGAQWAPVQRGR